MDANSKNLFSVAKKVWGDSVKLFSFNCVEVMLLRLRPDPETGKPVCCSWHTHEMKYNRFCVLEGSLLIQEDGRQLTLKAGMAYEVLPHIVHRFIVSEPVTVIEITWAESITEDIARRDEGHVLEKENAP